MKNITVKILPVLIFGVQTSLCFVEVREHIGFNNPNYLMVVVITLCILFLANHYFYFIMPYRKFEHFESTKEMIINETAEKFIDSFAFQIPLRISILTLERKLLSRIEPEGFRLFSKQLKTEWISRNMDHDPSRNLVITVNQGMEGEAFRDEEPKIFFHNETDLKALNLNKRQLQKLSNVKLTFSVPLRKMNRKTGRSSSEIIGIINISSTSDKAILLKTDVILRELLFSKSKALANNFSLII